MKDIEQSISHLFQHAAAGNAAVIGFRIIVGLIILFIASRIIEAVCNRIFKRLSEKAEVDTGNVLFLKSVVKVILYLVVILLILNGFGYKTSSLLTILGSLGLAIVLGLKDSLSNVASGLIIMLFKPFKVGDHIVEKSHDCEGTVTEIGLFFTKLITLDQKSIVIPNSLLTTTAVINHTVEEYRTLDLHYSVPYGTDLTRAKDLIRSTILSDQMEQIEKAREAAIMWENSEAADKSEEPDIVIPVYDPDTVHVFVYELGESAVILCSRSRVLNKDYWTTRFRLLEDVYRNFNAAGIEFAYPHMDVNLEYDPPRANAYPRSKRP